MIQSVQRCAADFMDRNNEPQKKKAKEIPKIPFEVVLQEEIVKGREQNDLQIFCGK